MDTVLIFAGGESLESKVLDELPLPDYVIAADSGFSLAQGLGFNTDVIVGDLDSLSPLSDVPDGTKIIQHPRDKDASDLELAFELALHEDPGRIVLVGAEGGRFDHELSAATLICSDRWKNVPEIDWVRQTATCSVVRGTRRLQGDAGAVVSLIAMGGDAHGVVTHGLQWELADEILYAGSSRGISNRIRRPEFSVRVGKGTLLAVLGNGLGDLDESGSD